MVKKVKAWLRAWKLRLSTAREIELEEKLKATEAALVTEKRHREIREADIQALQDDYAELQANYKALQYARCEDWRLGRHVAEAAERETLGRASWAHTMGAVAE